MIIWPIPKKGPHLPTSGLNHGKASPKCQFAATDISFKGLRGAPPLEAGGRAFGTPSFQRIRIDGYPFHYWSAEPYLFWESNVQTSTTNKRDATEGSSIFLALQSIHKWLAKPHHHSSQNLQHPRLDEAAIQL